MLKVSSTRDLVIDRDRWAQFRSNGLHINVIGGNVRNTLEKVDNYLFPFNYIREFLKALFGDVHTFV